MIEFTKAHACGNDFLIVDAEQVAGRDLALLARELCARTTGIGADGVEYLTRISERKGRIRLHNADGTVAEISGNGTRCVAAWMAYQNGLRPGDEVSIETDAGVRIGRLESAAGAEFRFTTTMGVPQVRRQRVKLDWGMTEESAFVEMGNPQFIVMVKDENFAIAGRPWQQVGAAICTHPDFPAGTNVEFVRRVAEDRIEIRIYERGVGPTSSSGTGTSASAAAMIALEGAPTRLRVLAPGGEQLVEWPDRSAELQLTGPAVVLARGQWLAGEMR
ncbi:MAG TPA: diaminopimelate epimerase [Acidobacteriaceae bacterium]|nr:diaminopimelate epimerase [Acidobacteriaceae bacterium]